MEKVTENILGIFCGTNGFRLAAITPQNQKEIQENGKTSDMLALRAMELIEKCGLRPKDIQKIVVCTGPGSFTSARVAVSFAKGFCCGSAQTKVVPFSTFEYYAFGKKYDAVLVPAFSDFVFAKNADGIEACMQFSDSFDGKIVADEKTFERWGKGTQIQANTNFLEFVAHKAKENGIAAIELKPVYLRASQAELARERQNGIKTKFN